MLVILGAEETDEEEEEEVTPKSSGPSKNGELSFLFSLAKKLHMTVRELQERTTKSWRYGLPTQWTADLQREAQRKPQKRRR